MNIFELFSKNDVRVNYIGKFEAPKQNLPKALTGLFAQMGMLNPSSLTSHATKAVTVKKRGDKYVIILNSYKPPIKVEWTNSMDILEFTAKLEELISKRNKIGFINQTNLDDGLPRFQIAFA